MKHRHTVLLSTVGVLVLGYQLLPKLGAAPRLNAKSTAATAVNANLSADADVSSNEKRARNAVRQLEKAIASRAPKVAATLAAADGKKDKPEKSTQDKLDDAHKKARDGGYDKEFHESIKKDGGDRLKEEWKKNCQERSTKPDKRELNCY